MPLSSSADSSGVDRMKFGLLAICLLPLSLPARAQQPAVPPSQPPTAAERMAASLEKQRQSVQRQLGALTASGTPSQFFALPWPQPLANPASALQADCEPLPSEQVNQLIGASAQKEGLAPDLLRAVIKQESGFKPCAVSSKGAQGLMQLMPATVEQFAIADPFDPKQNVSAGAKLLKQLLTKYDGNLRLALSAYNAGASVVDKIKDVPDIPETKQYVESILGTMTPQ